jgi:sugar lactone lactonase YvrE
VQCRFSGVLGQSQPPVRKPFPFIGSDGVAADAEGGIWSGSGNEIVRFLRKEDGSLILSGKFAIPATIRPGMGPRWDGRRIYFGGEDRKIYVFNPRERGTTLNIKPVAAVPDKTLSFAVSPSGLMTGFGKKGKVFTLAGDEVRAFDEKGADRGVVLTLKRPADAPWYYCSVGIEPVTGDLLVGSEFPDPKLYRFDGSGREITQGGWPRQQYVGNIITDNGSAWAIGHGVVQTLPHDWRLHDTFAIGVNWARWTRGLARDPAGNYLLACSQGILQVQFDSKGRSKNSRIGGLLGIRSMAVSPDGALVAGVENGQRMIRLSIDDQSDTPFQCDNYEPWRAGNGWVSRAAAIGWDRTKFLVLDQVQNRLWHFDPWHVGWQETPWVALTEPQTFKNPRGLAVGNLYIWVLDDTGLVEVDRRTYKRVKIVNLPGVNDVKKVCALSANGNEDLFIASDTQISAFARQKDGSYTLVWQSLKTFKTVATLAMVDDVLIVIDSGRSQIVFLDTRTGRLAGRVNRDAVPGGMVPTSLATSGRWIFIFDQAGNRILRFKLEKNK